MNKAERLLKLSNQKWLTDGSVLEKIELFSDQGVEQYILKDGHRIPTLIPRLNQSKDAQNWLSMQPNPLRWYSRCYRYDGFGETNEDNWLDGRGIGIRDDGDIDCGYELNGNWITGNHIDIYSDGKFRVAERYFKEGRVWERGTLYKTDGTEEHYDN